MRERISALFAGFVLAVALGVAFVPAVSGADCATTTGVVCGGQGYCCMAGFNWCIVWDCSR